ncbi:MAG: hypothetical protein AB1673_12080 [Actinomycetota bacterium]
MTGPRPVAPKGGREPWGAWARVVVAVAVRPRLWPTAAVQVGRLAPPGWWRRWPPVPRPGPEWLQFRMKTAYGDGGAVPTASDVVGWLQWCREQDLLRYPRAR